MENSQMDFNLDLFYRLTVGLKKAYDKREVFQNIPAEEIEEVYADSSDKGLELRELEFGYELPIHLLSSQMKITRFGGSVKEETSNLYSFSPSELKLMLDHAELLLRILGFPTKTPDVRMPLEEFFTLDKIKKFLRNSRSASQLRGLICGLKHNQERNGDKSVASVEDLLDLGKQGLQRFWGFGKLSISVVEQILNDAGLKFL